MFEIEIDHKPLLPLFTCHKTNAMLVLGLKTYLEKWEMKTLKAAFH